MPQPPKIFIFAMWGITIINILLVIMNWVSFGFHFLIYNPAKIRWVIYKIYYFIYTRICNVSLLYKDIATLGCYILVAFLYVCNIIGKRSKSGKTNVTNLNMKRTPQYSKSKRYTSAIAIHTFFTRPVRFLMILMNQRERG